MRGGDFWFCCGWWGGKALYETARHLYASSPTAVYVNGFLPSAANLKLKQGSVRIETEADIPKIGRCFPEADPAGYHKVPRQNPRPWLGHAQRSASQPTSGKPSSLTRAMSRLERDWNPGDKIDVHF